MHEFFFAEYLRQIEAVEVAVQKVQCGGDVFVFNFSKTRGRGFVGEFELGGLTQAGATMRYWGKSDVV